MTTLKTSTAASGAVLASNLYVAMTRARSLLAIYGVNDGATQTKKIFSTLADCLSALKNMNEFEDASEQIDDIDNRPS